MKRQMVPMEFKDFSQRISSYKPSQTISLKMKTSDGAFCLLMSSTVQGIY